MKYNVKTWLEITIQRFNRSCSVSIQPVIMTSWIILSDSKRKCKHNGLRCGIIFDCISSDWNMYNIMSGLFFFGQENRCKEKSEPEGHLC